MEDIVDERKNRFILKYRDFCNCFDVVPYSSDICANKEKKDKYLSDENFILGALTYLDRDDLVTFLFRDYNWKYIDRNILNNMDIVKYLAKKVPEIVVTSDLKYDVDAMREIASQPGIDPKIICYVDEDISNDLEFITDVIVNTDKPEEFYSHSNNSLGDSKLKYGVCIGEEIQKNPIFWELLNSKIRAKSSKLKTFDIEKELENVDNYFSGNVKKEENNNTDIIVNLRKKLKVVDGVAVGYKYEIKFDYSNDDQKKKIREVFDTALLPVYGANSDIAKEGKEYILPALEKVYGYSGIHSTNVPEYLLENLMRRFVELDGCTVKCGNVTAKGSFSKEIFDDMMKEINPKIELERGKDKDNVYLSLDSLEEYPNSPKSSIRYHLMNLAMKDKNIIPYYSDEFGDISSSKYYPFDIRKEIKGFDISKSSLPNILKDLVEFDNCIITCGDLVMEQNYSEDTVSAIKKYTDNNSGKKAILNLKKGDNNNYIAWYEYIGKDAGKYMIDAYNQMFKDIGANSSRALEGKDYLTATLVDVFGNIVTSEDRAFGIGESYIPEDLLVPVIRRMIEVDDCIVKCDDYIMEDYFSKDLLEIMKEHMDKNYGK